MGEETPFEKRYCEQGVLLLILYMRLWEPPVEAPAACERIRRVAEGYRTALLAQAERSFLSLREAYLADPSPRKRFSVRPYRAEYRLSYKRQEEHILARRSLRMLLCGREIFTISEEDIFDKNGYLLKNKKKKQQK